MTDTQTEPGEPTDDGPAPVDPLMPQMRRTEGAPAWVRANREQQAARNQLDRAQVERRIEAHMAAHRMALDFLQNSHQWVADTYDLDLVGDTRPAATWQMAGRCIGIARLICDALSLGYTSEVLHLARALHEANRLTDVFPLPEGTEALTKWLADEGDRWVRPWEARAAEASYEQRLASAMRQAGLPELLPTGAKTREIYGHQSQAAHHRRKWTQDAVAPLLRTMISGPTEVWERRAATAASLLPVVEEAVISVGGALDLFMPSDWYAKNVKPLVSAFEALRRTEPLTST